MKIDDNHIDKAFSQKLTNLETEVPESCWAAIEQALPKRQSRPVIPLWGRIAVAAVGLFIVGTIGYLTFNNQNYQQQNAALILKTKTVLPSSALQKDKTTNLLTDNQIIKPKSINTNDNTVQKRHNRYRSNESVSYNINITPGEGTTAINKSNTTSPTIEEYQEEIPATEMTDVKTPTQEEMSVFANAGNDQASEVGNKGKSTGRHSSIGLLAALTGPQGSQNKSSFTSMRTSSRKDLLMSFISENQNLAEQNNTSVQHDLPISIGISLEKEISGQLAIQTGICGTYLRSTQKLNTSLYFTDEIQELYYLGLPLSIAYKFAETERFSFYMKAGGMVEKNIGGRWRDRVRKDGEVVYTKVQHDLENKLQWSTHFGGGANYNLSDRMKLYIEPALTYYFDNNSNVDNIHKQQRMDITLQAGLRAVFDSSH